MNQGLRGNISRLLVAIGLALTASSASAVCTISNLRAGGQAGDAYVGPTCNSDGSYRGCVYAEGVDFPGGNAVSLTIDGVDAPIAFQVDLSPTVHVVCATTLPLRSGPVDVEVVLAPGCSRSELDIYLTPTECPAGENGLASVEGHVFEDLNGDGDQDPGEPDLPGVTVDIVSGLDSRSAVTDAFGNYGSVITAGDVTVDVDETTLPQGYVQTAGTDPTVIQANAGVLTDAGVDGYRLAPPRPVAPVPTLGTMSFLLLAGLLGFVARMRLRANKA